MNKTWAAYVRVSTGNQSTGLESQVRAVREYCRVKGIENYVIYQDENQSGMKHSRPALDQMLKAARDGQLCGIIVYSFSRFARSVTHLLSALQEFKKLEIKFHSLTESLDLDSPLGIACFTILGAIAQLERDILAERVRNGLLNAKSKGIHIGRKKTRPSELIRTLIRSGLSYRECSRIAKHSQGSVGAEIKCWRKELEAVGRTLEQEIAENKPRATGELKSASGTAGIQHLSDGAPGIEVTYNSASQVPLELVR